MPRIKLIDIGRKSLPIDLSVQLLPGNFEHPLSHLRFTGIGREEGKKPGEPSGKRNSKNEIRDRLKSINEKSNSATALTGASGRRWLRDKTVILQPQRSR